MAEPRAIVPEKGIRPGLNSSGADIAKHVFVSIADGGTDDPTEIELPQGAGVKVFGVVVSSQVRAGVAVDVGIPDTEIGDIQVEGRAVVLAGGTFANGDNLQADTAGKAIEAASSDIVVAKAMEAATDGDFVEVELVGAAQSFIVP